MGATLMNESELNAILEKAVANLFAHQPNIYEFAPGTGQTEWNLAHHLAVELRAFFPSLDHDLDVLKRDYDNMRPDIIFHKRGTHEANHLVVEVKRDSSSIPAARSRLTWLSCTGPVCPRIFLQETSP